MNPNSILSPQVKLGLGISAAVALIIALIGVVLTFWYKKKLQKKFYSPDEIVEFEKLKITNPNYGIVLEGIKKYYDVIWPDFFIAFCVNTIYLNKYSNIYVEDENDYLSISLAALSYQNVKQHIANKNNIKLQQIIKEKQISAKDFKISDQEIAKNERFDFILNLKTISLPQSIDTFLPYLSDNGILLLNFFDLKQIKASKEFFEKQNLKYETLKFGNKNVILLAKNSVRNKISDEREN